jgi:hypothetical protein
MAQTRKCFVGLLCCMLNLYEVWAQRMRPGNALLGGRLHVELVWAQVMHPWRSIFRALFRQDQQRAQPRAALRRRGRPAAATQLGARLAAAAGAEWHAWASSLAALLQVLPDEMPVLPPEHPCRRTDADVRCWSCCNTPCHE